MTIKNLILISLFGIISFSLSGNPRPDTPDHWTVLYNTRVLARLDSSSHDKLIVIKAQRILPTDVLSLDYWCDAPCDDCKTSMYMDSERKFLLAKAHGSNTRLTINIVKLFNAWRDSGLKPIGVYYKDGRRETPVFIITFSN